MHGLRDGPYWVFGYGSLMWNPGFPHADAKPALLYGYHRAYSLYSHRSYGTPERPGLVLVLMRGGSCRGMALRVAPADWEGALAYLDRRENAYRRRVVPLRMGGATVRAVTYVADEANPRFAGKLPRAEAARLIHQGVGPQGTSRDYLRNTARHLEALGYNCTESLRLLRLVDALDGG